MNDVGSPHQIALCRPILIAVFIGFVWPHYTFAQTNSESEEASEETPIETIVVTVEKREENLLDVPVTITAFSSKMIEDLGMTNNADLELLVPGLHLADVGYMNGTTIRGMQPKREQETHQDQTVATYIDGIYTTETYGAALDLFDLERIEVGRGPQGTLNGRNSVAGSVSYFTRKPTEDWDSVVLTEVTSLATQRVNFVFGGPLEMIAGPQWKDVSFRLSGGLLVGDGAQENTGSGGDYNAPERQSIAAAFRYKTEVTDIYLRYSHATDVGSPAVHVGITEQIRDNADLNYAWYQYQQPVPSISENCPNLPAPSFVAPGSFRLTNCENPRNKILANRSGYEENESQRIIFTVDFAASKTMTLRYMYGKGDSDTALGADLDQTARIGSDINPLWASDANVAYSDAYFRHLFNVAEESHEGHLITNFARGLNYILGFFSYRNEQLWINQLTDDSPSRKIPNYPPSANPDLVAQTLGYADCASYVRQAFGATRNCIDPIETGLHTHVFSMSRAETIALFGNVERQFGDSWIASLSMRHTADKISEPVCCSLNPRDVFGNGIFTRSIFPGAFEPRRELRDDRYAATIFGLGLEYTSWSYGLIYGRLSTGHRSAGIQGVESAFNGEISPEQLINYELGFKGLFLEHRLQLTASFWFNSYEDLQYTGTNELPADQYAYGFVPGFKYGENTQNIKGTSMSGVDLEYVWYLTDALRLSGYYAFQTSSVGDFETVIFGDPDTATEPLTVGQAPDGSDIIVNFPLPRNVEGNELPQMPNHKYSTTLSYTVSLGWGGEIHLLGTYSFVDERWPDIANIPHNKIPSYQRVDLRGTWTSYTGRWQVTGYVQNALDEIGIREYVDNYFNQGIAMGRLTEPQEVGVQVRWRPSR